jgi:hypothetical protein
VIAVASTRDKPVLRCPRPERNSKNIRRFVVTNLFIIGFVYSSAGLAAKMASTRHEGKDVLVRLVARTPEQLAAFYIGRGFKQDAIAKIQETCFITVIIKNKNIDVLWLELDNWLFTRNGQPIKRIDRNYWKQKWQEVNLPVNHQSTFGWTLLPEARDLRRDESVGGNVVIPRQTKPFDITMHFKTGADKSSAVKIISFENVQCENRK